MNCDRIRRSIDAGGVGGRALVKLISTIKWVVYPFLVRFAPRLAMAIHEPECTRAFWNAIREGMVIVDGGANRGGYSMLASLRTGPTGRVYAFEPAPLNFGKLTRLLSGFQNVVPVEKAIGAVSGVAEFHLSDFHQAHSLTRDMGTGRTTEVAVTSLDDFVRERGLAGVDFIKLDIEGTELEAVAGMESLLRGARRPIVLCEVHPPNTPDAFRDLMAKYGYRSELLDSHYTGSVQEFNVHLLATPT